MADRIKLHPIVLIDIKTPSFYGTPAHWVEMH